MESGTFADFFQQIQGQSSILALIRLFAVLLAFTVVAMIYVRVRRGRIGKQPNTTSGFSLGASLLGFLSQSAANSTLSTPSTSQVGGGDMPDLNMLLSTDPAGNTAAVPQQNYTRQPGVISIQMSDGRQVEAAEMIIISRDRVSDNLVVQIGEYAYDGTEDGVHPDFRRRFVKLMREVSDIAPALSKVSDTPVQSRPQAEAVPLQPSRSTPGVSATNPVAEPAEQPALDLAGQIEAFLQRKLAAQPGLAARGIHVHSSADGGVRIEVDGQYFESVDDVEDPAVQAFLQQTIAEWQSSR